MGDDGLFIGEHQYCLAKEFPVRSDGTQRRSCGSSDALALYEHTTSEGVTWYDGTCFSCKQKFDREEVHSSSLSGFLGVGEGTLEVVDKKEFENKATKKKKITREEVQDLWLRTGGKDGNSGKGYRGLSDWVLKFYGHRVEYDKQDKVSAIYYPETSADEGKLNGYKSRHLPKKFGIGNLGKTGVINQLSGQHKFTNGGRYALIAAGEEDKCAAQDMLREYQRMKGQEDYDPYAVVSPTTGEPSAAKQCRQQYDWFDKFEVIVIGMDSDEVGEEAALEIAKVLPRDKVRIARWSGKDPNQMLLDGKKKQFWSDFFGAKEVVDSGVYNANDDMVQDVIDVLTTPRIPLPPFASKLEAMTKGSGLFTRSIYSLIGDTSVGKCHGKGTTILMHDLTTKKVEDVEIGDLLMGDDGTKREVKKVHKGFDTLYNIGQCDGVTYTVNSKHTLSLRAGFDTVIKGPDRNKSRRCAVDYKKGQIVNIDVQDYIKLPALAKRSLKGYKGSIQEGITSNIKHPWLLGMWLGDGHTNQARITLAKSNVEIIDKIEDIVREEDYYITVPPSCDRDTTYTYSIGGGFRTYLTKHSLIGFKHIPKDLLLGSREERLQLLAGIIDSDGYLNSNGSSYEVTQKSKKLAEDIQTLCRTLGYRCSINLSKKSSQKGTVGEYHRMCITGAIHEIPVVLSYKKAKTQSDLRKNNNTAIKVSCLGEGEYYGFEVDGNHLYCLEDFTVTHNSTHIDAWIFHWMFNVPDHKVGIVSVEATKGEWVAGMLSTYLENNLWWIPVDEIESYMNTPEVKARINNFFYNEYGESRFAIVDDREGTVESLQKCIDKLERQYGCTIIVNDVLTDILRVVDNEAQARHFNWQSNFVKNGATIFNILHTRKSGDNRGGKPTFPNEFDAYGNSIFVQKAAGNFVIARNKEAPNEDTIEQNTTYLRVPKLRKGVTGSGGAWYYDGETRKVYDRDTYFKDNPDKLPTGYDLSISSFDRAYWEEGGRGWDGVSDNKGGFTKKAAKVEKVEKDWEIDVGGGTKF